MKLMKLLRKRFAKFGNKGFSLVELICTMAIVSVVGTAVSGVLVVTGDSYKRGTTETELQQEAQLVANQINDLLIDAPSSVSYDDATDKLTITKDGVTYTVYYDATSKKLYFDKDGESQIMARNMDSFHVDVSNYASTGYAKMNMQLSNEGRVYPAVFTISARNKDMTTSAATVVTLNTDLEHLMEPCTEKTLTASVTGLTNTDVTWSFFPAIVPTDSNTKFEGGNKLKIGKDETQNLLRLQVATDELDPASGYPLAQRMVTVKIRRANSISIVEGPTKQSGDEKKAGATYKLVAVVAGNNMEKHSSESDADYAAIDPYAVTWSVTGGAVVDSVTTDATDPTRREVIIRLTSDIPAGDKVTIKATSAHAAGSNKSTTAYANLSDTKEISVPAAPADPYIIPGAGWMRMSNTEQASIADAINSVLKPYLERRYEDEIVGALRHEVLIKYREYPGGTYQDAWLPNIYGDGNNSMKINLRPLVTGAMDYREDYEIMLKLRIVDETGREVWPIAAETPDSEYLLVQIMPKVGVTFKSDLLGFAETQKVEEAVAPVLSGAQRDQQYQIMEKVSQVGIDLSGNAFENNLRFEIDKKDGSGYSSVTEGIEIQNNQGKCMVTFRNDDFKGLYRIRVKAIEMDNYIYNPDGTLTKDGKVIYHLSNTTDDHNIFYFRVN